jgi:hypothetical protein
MGVPFSKEIGASLRHVEGALEHAKFISVIAVLCIAAITVLMGLIFIALIALLISVNPDLAEERELLVTPIVRWTLKLAVMATRSKKSRRKTHTR